MNAYYQTFSEEGHLRAREVIEQAVGQDPDNSNVWAQLANVCRDEFWLGHNPLPNSLDRCLEAARRAVELDPGSDRAYASLASAHFHRSEVGAFRSNAERVLKMAPNSGMRFNQMGLYLYMLDDLERGMELVKRGMDLVGEVASASQPAMMTWPYFMDHYRNERYEAALEETHKMEILRFWGTHVFVAAASARLELKTEMQAAVTELLQLRPNFAEKAEESIRNLITSKEVTDQLIDGLRKAGLDIPNGPVFDV